MHALVYEFISFINIYIVEHEMVTSEEKYHLTHAVTWTSLPAIAWGRVPKELKLWEAQSFKQIPSSSSSLQRSL